MKVLFIGGTGLISTASTQLAVERGIDLWILNRGQSKPLPGVQTITANIGDAVAAAAALEDHTWDAVVQWIAFDPAAIERDIALFSGKTKQYIFISSASAYQKPSQHYIITESTPLENPFWSYSRNKAAAEERLLTEVREKNFPGVIVRPSLTYGDTQVPLIIDSWEKSWTAVERLRKGEPLIIPGDGNSLWTLTHNSDFAVGLVGLLGNPETIGEAFHITSDEVLTWNDIYQQTAAAAGVTEPKFIHIASDFIIACLPEEEGSLLGDKTVSCVFDNSKIKKFVPDFGAQTKYADGIKKTIAWFDANPDHKLIDAPAAANWDKIIAAYDKGLAAAQETFHAQ